MENVKQKINILLVDDNPSNLLALETILQAPDRNLVRASSGEEALRFLLDEDAAVILLDVRMPNLDGFDTAALIRGRERTRGVPIIFLTAYDDAGDSRISMGYSLGAVDYIIKPIDPEALKSKVAVFIELYRKTEKIKRQADLLREQNIELENANLQRLSRLIDLGRQLAAERDPEMVLKKFCDAARAMVGARFATVGILEDDGVTLRHFFISGFDREEALKIGVPQSCQRILEQRFKDVRSLRLSGVKGLRILPEQTPVKSFVGAPILRLVRSEAEPQNLAAVRGWLYLADKIDAPAFSEADERFTVTLTQAVAFYENARLYADLQRHAAALEQEIAERKRAEAAVAQMVAIVESSSDAIISKDLNGIIVSWNKGAEKLLGYTAEEIVGKPVTTLFPPDRVGEEPEILGRIRRGEVVDHYETVRRRKDGSEIDISLTVSPIRDKSGKVVGASKIARDISERKRLEIEREEMLIKESGARAEAESARAEAEEANRLKDEFLAIVSHELRAPLNAMLGWVTLAREGSLDEEGKERALEIVERNARTQKKLVDDLLDVSSIITGNLSLEFESADIASIIESAVESVRPAAEAKGVGLQTQLEPLVDMFQLDRNRFQQVISNLVHNAVKFTPAGGAVKVRLRYRNGRAEIEVIDTGIGIAPEFLPFVFDRFRQADGSITRRHGGLGLGLAIVRSLVEMHGGRVGVESAGLGLGATFRITLPLPNGFPYEAPLMAAASSEVAMPDSAPKLSGLRALVVDDRADERELLAEVLSMKEAEVRTAGGMAEAMRIMTAWRPEIVISDIAMPGGGGYELIRRMRSGGIRAPAIAITAYASDEDRQRALAAGFQMHLPKPIEPYELVVSVASLTGRLP